MMPRQPSIDRDSLIAVLCTSKEAILLNGKIATPAATIWTELSQQLENKMSPKALHTFVKSNRHNIWSCLEISEQESDRESSVETGFDSGSISPGQDDCSGFQLEVMDSGMAQLDISVKNGPFFPESPCLRPLPKESECPVEFKTGASTSGKMLCAGTVTHSYSIGEIAWINTDLANTTQFPLSEFPPIGAVQGKTFTLRGVIAFKGSLTKDGLGHYIAYCRRAPCVWELYDDLANVVKTVTIQPHAVLYTAD